MISALLLLAACHKAPAKVAAAPQNCGDLDPAAVQATAEKDGPSAKPVTILRSPGPVYPPALKREGIAGRVSISFVVGTDGQVEPCSVIVRTTTDERFNASAVAAVLAERFAPAKDRNGADVRKIVTQLIAFGGSGTR